MGSWGGTCSHTCSVDVVSALFQLFHLCLREAEHPAQYEAPPGPIVLHLAKYLWELGQGRQVGVDGGEWLISDKVISKLS